MAHPGQLLNPPSSEPVVYDGKIVVGAISTDDLIEAVLPHFHPTQRWGPMPWMPRGAGLPQAGDRCCVVLAQTEEEGVDEPWCVAWWPS